MRDALLAFGGDPERAGSIRRTDVAAFVEAHIEQGPTLEAEGLPLGVVTAINGATRLEVVVDGLAGHAGATPMHLRQDALTAAAEMTLAIEGARGANLISWRLSAGLRYGQAQPMSSRATSSSPSTCARRAT